MRCLGNACFWQSHYAESQAYFEEALEIHRAVGDLRGELSVLNNLGHVLELLGQPQKALQFFEQALNASQKIGDLLATGVVLTNLGGLALRLGHFEQAQSGLEQALEIRQQIGNEEGAAIALKLLGDAACQQGRFAPAKAHYEQALEINTRIYQPRQSGETLLALAALHRAWGAYERAEVYLAQAQATLPVEDTANQAQVLAEGCLLNYMRGDYPQAWALGEQAVVQSRDFPAILAEALTNFGQVLAEMGQMAVARQHFQQALELRQNLDQPHLAVEARTGLAHIASDRE